MIKEYVGEIDERYAAAWEKIRELNYDDRSSLLCMLFGAAKVEKDERFLELLELLIPRL